MCTLHLASPSPEGVVLARARRYRRADPVRRPSDSWPPLHTPPSQKARGPGWAEGLRLWGSVGDVAYRLSRRESRDCLALGNAERENFIRKQRRAAVGPRTFTTPTRCETHFCDEIARTHPKVRKLSLWHVCARSGLLAACNSN